MKRSLKLSWRNMGSFLDLLLPETRGGMNRNRSYLAVASLLFVSVVVAINLVSFFFMPVSLEVVAGTGVIFAAAVGSLVGLKRGVKVERVTGCFLVLLTSALTLIITYSGRSSFVPAIFFFLIIIMYVSFFAFNRWAIFQALFVVVATVFFFANTNRYGLIVPFGWPFEEFVHRLQFVVVVLCVTGYTCMVLHEFFRKKTETLLSQEKAWLVRSSRLHEISTLADSLSFQISAPLKEFGQNLKALRDAYPSENFAAFEALVAQAMFRAVEELIQVSRSFDWIYRSQKQDNLVGAELGMLLSHLRVLLEGKALENGWSLAVHTDHPDETMHGPIPSLVLLLVTLAHRNFDRYTANGNMTLVIEARKGTTADTPFTWHMSWPKTLPKALRARGDSTKHDLSKMVDDIREALIDELRKDCLGQIEWRMTDDRFEVNLRVPRHPQ